MNGIGNKPLDNQPEHAYCVPAAKTLDRKKEAKHGCSLVDRQPIKALVTSVSPFTSIKMLIFSVTT